MSTPCVILANTRTGRFHPVPFRMAPMPGPVSDLPVERYKSIGHHTVGFPTLDEAVACVRSQDGWWLPELHVEEWNDEADPIPALVRVFPISATEGGAP